MKHPLFDDALSNDRRIYLRPVEYGDLEFTRKNRQHPEIRAATLGRVFPITPENELRWYEGLGVGEYPSRIALIACDGSDTPVGVFFLAEINWIDLTAWLGMWVAPEEQGKGHGRAILEEGLAYGYTLLGMRQIRLEVVCDNDRAIALYSSTGFQEEGRLLRARRVGVSYLDVAIMRHNQPPQV
jgi:diamine N-acetyltransferase